MTGDATNGGHVLNDHEEYLAHLAAAMEATAMPAEFCRHCRGTTEVIPGTGSRWLVGYSHDKDCPDYFD